MLHCLTRRALAARASDRGETLIELIFAVAVIATAGVALIAGVMTGISASGLHKSLTQNDTALRSYADQVAQKVQRESNWPGCNNYTSVPTPSGYSYSSTIAWSYWAPTTGSSDPSDGSWVPIDSSHPCPAAGSTYANQPELATVTVTSSGSTSTQSVIVRSDS